MKCPKCGKESLIGSETITSVINRTDFYCTNCGYVWGDLPQATAKKSTDSLVGGNYQQGCIQQGWQCPKCGAVLSPNTPFCPFCSRQTFTPTFTCGVSGSGEYVNPNVSTSISKEKKQ